MNNFRNLGRRISHVSLSASTDVEFFEDDGFSFARLRCGYTVLEKKQSYSTVEVYLLRKDADGHWKIYGWDLAENVQFYLSNDSANYHFRIIVASDDYSEMEKAVRQAKPAYLTFDILVTDIVRRCGTFNCGTNPL